MKSLTYVEVDVPTFQDFNQAKFDGTSYLTRDAGLTGAVDSKLIMFSGWFKLIASTGGRLLASVTTLAGGTPSSRIACRAGTNDIRIIGHNAAGTPILDIGTVTGLPLGVWLHVMASADLTDTNKRHVYVNGVSSLDVTAYTNDVIDFTLPDWGVGAYADGSLLLNGELRDIWFMPGVYIDLSVAANRAKFITTDGHPTFLGDAGEKPTGTPPLVYLSGLIDEWATNKGTGGGFTTHGALQAADETFLTETRRFAIPTDYLPSDIEAIASLQGVSFNPAVISLGQSLGQRATLTATFRDHRHIFMGEDFASGSFWGKWRARYGTRLRGIPLRWINGLLGQSLAAMETRHFIVEATDGPNLAGTYTITAKDALKFADGDRAQAPVLSNGSLVADITNVATSLTLTPVGIGDSEYPHSGYVAIGGNEIVSFTRIGGNDPFTKVLLHMNGTDGSTTFTDNNSGGSAKTWTAAGNAQIDTADSKFDGASGLFDGTGDWVSTPDHADFELTTKDFTVDFWFKCNRAGGVDSDIGGQTSAGTPATTSFFCDRSSTNVMRFFVSDGTNFAAVAGTTQFTNALNTGWHHFAGVRTGNVLKLFIDGVQEGGNVAFSASIPNSTGLPTVGRRGDVANSPWIGWIDEFRLSVGIARWTANFTVATQAFQSGDLVNIVRAQMNTDAAAHQAGDRVQLCLYYQGQDPANIIFDLMNVYAGIPSIWLPLTSWLAETNAYLQRVYTAFIAEPTDVRDLVDELIEQAALAIWWDPLGEQVRLMVLRSILTDAATFGPDQMIEGSLQIVEQPNARVSQVWTYFGQRNPLEGIEEEKNFRSTLLTIDPETELGYGTPAIKKIFSRWIPFGGRTIATRLNNIVIGRFKNPPRRFTFDVFKPGQQDVILGVGYQVQAWPIQNVDGTVDIAPIQVTRLAPFAEKFSVEAEEMIFQDAAPVDLVNRVIIIDANSYNLNMRTMHDSLYPVPTGTESPAININCIVESGVIVGSKDIALNSFEVGDWPAGFNASNLKITIRGRIQGKGGIGGEGNGNWFQFPGLPGGPALYTRELVTVDVTSGQIWGGGGGGGGGTHGSKATGGGGGAGADPGNGGAGSNGNTDRDGFAGTTEAGGAGGNASGGAHGGPGGGPGLTGSSSTDYVINPGGAPGRAVDGVSFVTYIGTGDRRGPEVN